MRRFGASASPSSWAGGIALVAVAVLYVAAVGTRRGRASEEVGRLAERWRDTFVDGVSTAILVALVPIAIGLVALGLIIATVKGGLRRVTFASALIALVGTNVLVQGAKLILEYVNPIGGEALRHRQGAFPSGHAAMATSAALALIMVAPARRRRVITLCASAFALTVNLMLLVIGWHYASDVIGAALTSFAVAQIVGHRAGVVATNGRTTSAIAVVVAAAGVALLSGAAWYDTVIGSVPAPLIAGVGAILVTTIGVVVASHSLSADTTDSIRAESESSPDPGNAQRCRSAPEPHDEE